MTRVLIAGVSARAAARSAADAGFDVTAVDAFADLDQHPLVRAHPVRGAGGFTAAAAARLARAVECDAVAYLSTFENHPAAVRALAAGRALWGNPPAVLRRVRNPLELSASLRRRACPTPAAWLSSDAGPQPGARCLIKPLRSGGGHDIRAWAPGRPLSRGRYVQEYIEGVPGSIAFVAAGGRAVPLAISTQLIGDAAFGTDGFRYCGSLLASSQDERLVSAACALARAVAEEFSLVGVNGIDFVVRDGVPWPIEVNPRWSASMELVERAHGINVFALHAAACARGELPPSAPLDAVRGAYGKAIVFAREPLVVGDTSSWLRDDTVADVPRCGESIAAGRPVCTVFARDDDETACRAALLRRAAGVYETMAAWAHEVVR